MTHCCRREQNIDNDAIIPATTSDGVVIIFIHADQRSLNHNPRGPASCDRRAWRHTPGAQAARDAALSRHRPGHATPTPPAHVPIMQAPQEEICALNKEEAIDWRPTTMQCIPSSHPYRY